MAQTEEQIKVMFQGKEYSIPKILADKWQEILQKDRDAHPIKPIQE